MRQWLLMCAALCVGSYLFVALTRPFTTSTPSTHPRPDAGEQAKGGDAATPQEQKPQEAPAPREVMRMAALPARAVVKGAPDKGILEPYTVERATVHVYDSVQVPSEREGKLNFVATEFKGPLPPEWKLKEMERRGKAYRQEVYFLAIEAGAKEVIPPGEEVTKQLVSPNTDPNKHYRRWKEGDLLDAGILKAAKENRWLRRLEVGDTISGPRDGQHGDLLALVNPAIAFDDLQGKAAKLELAAAEWRASEKTAEELYRQWTRDKELFYQRGGGAIPLDEVKKSELGYLRYHEEAIGKNAAIVSAKQELHQAITVTKLHEIRAMQSGTIQGIHKNTGDAVKNLEPVMEIANTDRPRFEGKIELQYSHLLRERMLGLEAEKKGEAIKVTVEVTRPVPPKQFLAGHTREVTAITVSPGDKPYIISGDDVGSLRVWTPEDKGAELWSIGHSTAIRSLASTQNDILIGFADGTVYLTPLKTPKQGEEVPVRYLTTSKRTAPAHGGSVNAVAFSPDGKLCATGSEDRSIMIWNVASGELVAQKIGAHKGPVTSVQFASNNRVFSAGRGDGLLTEWTIDGNTMKETVFNSHRSNNVPVLGLDRTNKRVLVDEGKGLRVYSLENGGVEGELRNTNGAGNFSTMALFSADGNNILTNTNDGRLQLWRSPSKANRAYEQRQLVWTNGAATCGAFSSCTKDNFAVTGSADGKVLIWALPDASEQPLDAILTYVQRTLDTNEQQVSVWADPAQVPVPSWVVSARPRPW